MWPGTRHHLGEVCTQGLVYRLRTREVLGLDEASSLYEGSALWLGHSIDASWVGTMEANSKSLHRGRNDKTGNLPVQHSGAAQWLLKRKFFLN